MTTNDKELRERILIDFLIHEEDCKYSLYDKPCTCVQQQVADSIMHLVSESMRRREAEAVVRELEDVYDWRQLYALNGGSISVFVVHANRIKERIIELEATISKEGAADA